MLPQRSIGKRARSCARKVDRKHIPLHCYGVNLLGTGIVTRETRLIYYLGAVRSLFDVAQDCDHAGRDNEIAYCRVLYKQRFITSFGRVLINRADNAVFISKDDMQLKTLHWNKTFARILTKISCREDALYAAMNDERTGLCPFDADSENCDACIDHVGSQSLFNSTSKPMPTSPPVHQPSIPRIPGQAQ